MNNRGKQQNGNSRDLFTKIGEIKAWKKKKKNRNVRLNRNRRVKKRWQEYIELYKKGLNGPDNHDNVVTPLEPDVLEYEVKWALGTIIMKKASEGDRILVGLFKILKYDVVKVLHSICQQIRKTQQGPQEWKKSVFIPSQRRAMPKNVQTTTRLHSFHKIIRLCSKSFKLGFSST